MPETNIDYMEGFSWAKELSGNNLFWLGDTEAVAERARLGWSFYSPRPTTNGTEYLLSISSDQGVRGFRVTDSATIPMEGSITGDNDARRFAIYRPWVGSGGPDSAFVSFVVPPDFMNIYRPVGALGDLSSSNNNIHARGFERGPDGRVRLVYYTSRVSHPEFPWTTLPAGVWREAEPNCITLGREANNALRLYINGVDTGLVEGTNTAPTNFGIRHARLVAGSFTIGEIVFHNAPIAPYRLRRLVPGADLTPQDFVPDTGADGFSRLSEAPPDGDESYVAAAAPGARSAFQLYDLNGQSFTVNNAQDVLKVRVGVSARTVSGDARPLHLQFNGANADDPVTVRGEYSEDYRDLDINPDTGLAWAPSDFDNMAVGFGLPEDN